MRILYTVLTASSLLLSHAAAAFPGIPSATYNGEGRMRLGSQPHSTYDSRLIIKDDRMTASYVYPGGRSVDYTAEFHQRSDGSFDIKADGEVIGYGYCEEGMCHLEVSKYKAEETLVYSDGTLLRLGSMEHGDVKLFYSEILRSD